MKSIPDICQLLTFFDDRLLSVQAVLQGYSHGFAKVFLLLLPYGLMAVNIQLAYSM